MEYIGITETYDPAFDYTWIDNLKLGNIIITKQLTDRMIDALIKYKDRCILHLTCTGMGGNILEPNVPTIEYTKSKYQELIDKGFPEEQVVLRISPIIPTEKGIKTVIKVLDTFKDTCITRIRFSTINMYNHVKFRFGCKNIRLPYNTYSCNQEMRDNLINSLLNYFNITTTEIFDKDCCGEVDLNKKVIERIGCVSQKDLKILNIEDKIELVGSGKQRIMCMCPDNKKQIIRRKPGKCKHDCLYCYWKD